MRRILITASLAAVALVVASSAAAATSPGYQVTAVGLPQGGASAFTGLAVGSAGDRGMFRATLTHDALAACATVGLACNVTGGTFSLRSNGGQLDGSFTGGLMTLTSQTGACGTQQYTVAGSVFTRTGPLDFSGVLTQLRLRIFGQCRAIAATLQGNLVQSIGEF